MQSVTVYYDDQKESCRKYAEIFAGYEYVECKKISECADKNIIFENSERVGFLFESDREMVPYSMKRVIQKIVMNKKGKYFVNVTGGSRELSAAKMAYNDLESRGYKAANIYSQYYFEKCRLNAEQAVKQILDNIEKADGFGSAFAGEEVEMNSRQIRKLLRRGLKDYKKYRKESCGSR